MRVWPLLNRRLSRHFQGVLQHPLPSENAAQGRYGRFFSVTYLIRVQRALTGPVERASAPSQEPWR